MRLVVDISKQFPDITGPLSDAFAAELKKIARVADFSELVLNFKDLRAINSMAMGVIFEVSHALVEKGRTLSIVNVPDKIANLLRMARLDHLIH